MKYLIKFDSKEKKYVAGLVSSRRTPFIYGYGRTQESSLLNLKEKMEIVGLSTKDLRNAEPRLSPYLCYYYYDNDEEKYYAWPPGVKKEYITGLTRESVEKKLRKVIMTEYNKLNDLQRKIQAFSVYLVEHEYSDDMPYENDFPMPESALN